MRNLLTAIILILFSFGNEIDSLKTNADVESFIHKLSFWGKDSGMYDDETIQKLIINPGFYAHDTANQRIAKELGIKDWQKIDLNNDSKTDLLVNVGFEEDGECMWIAVLDQGGKYYLHQLSYSNYEPTYFASVKTVKGQREILLREYSGDFREKRVYEKTITLVCKYNEFIEPAKNTEEHNIEKVTYILMGRWRGEHYTLTINVNDVWKYSPSKYSKDTMSHFGKLDSTKVNELFSLLHYINFSKLDTDYKVNATDQSYCELMITYDHGKIKKIGDYGLQGTYGLMAVYNKFWNFARGIKTD